MRSAEEIQDKIEKLQAQQLKLRRRIGRKKLQAALMLVLVVTAVAGVVGILVVRASPWGTSSAGWFALGAFLYFIVGLNLAVVLSRAFRVNMPLALRWTRTFSGIGYYRGKDSPRHKMERKYAKNGRTLDALFVARELLDTPDGQKKLAALMEKERLEAEKREKLQFQTEGQRDTTYLEALKWCASEGGEA